MATGKSENTCLYTLKTQFFSMVLVKDVQFRGDDGNFLFETPQQQADLLEMTVNSALCQKFPPSLSYQQSFVKAVLKKCELNNFEISDELYESYASLIARSLEVKDVCYKTYILSPDEHITLEESTSMISHGTTGLCTWQAAKYLAEWAVENTTILENKRVLELGSGVGLTGLVVCKFCCPATYTFTDCHDHVLSAVEKNITINSTKSSTSSIVKPNDAMERLNGGANNIENDVGCKEDDVRGSRKVARFRKLDWEEVTEQEVIGLGSEVILAADVVYDDRLLEPLGRVLLSLLSSSPSVAYISSTIRNEATFNKFIDVLDEKSISWTELEDKPKSLFLYDRSVHIKLMRLSYHGLSSN